MLISNISKNIKGQSKYIILLCLFLFSPFSFAKLIKYESKIISENKYSLEEACFFLTKRKSPLIEVVGSQTLDCMGTKKNILSFCSHKEVTNPYYSTGQIKENKVVCQSSKRVLLKWDCRKDNQKYCKDKELGCYHFQQIFAKRLKLVHSSLDGELSCYFDIKSDFLSIDNI